MDFSLSDDQLLLRDTVRQFMEAELRPVVRQNDRDEIFPAAQIRKLGEMGCCGMCVPEEWGGAGMSTVSYVVMLEEVARVCAATAVTLDLTVATTNRRMVVRESGLRCAREPKQTAAAPAASSPSAGLHGR